MGTSPRAKAALATPIASEAEFKRIFSSWMQQANQGGVAVTGTVTLDANSPSTTVTDKRAGPTSYIGFMPLTARAAQEWKNLVISQQGSGTFMIGHTNNAFTDRTYTYAIMG
jgi:hypothetical protein